MANSKTAGEVKLRYGLTDANKIICISELSKENREKNGDFYCPNCKSPLVAKMGNKNQRHFAHKNADCNNSSANETALHMLAKEILVANMKITIPAYEISGEEYYTMAEGPFYDDLGYDVYGELLDNFKYSDALEIKFDEVISEKKIGEIVPDILLMVGKKQLIIEIAVTHFVDDEKLDRIKKLNISAIEINLSAIKNKELKREEIENLIITDVKYKTWLHNIKHDKALLNLTERNRDICAKYYM